jgi:hypothetical protein
MQMLDKASNSSDLNVPTNPVREVDYAEDDDWKIDPDKVPF